MKYEIPLAPIPQTFRISLKDTIYKVTLRWNFASATWTLDIADKSNTPILYGIPLVANINLLDQFDYLNFGGSLIAQTDGNLDEPPTFGNAGTTGHLYFITP